MRGGYVFVQWVRGRKWALESYQATGKEKRLDAKVAIEGVPCYLYACPDGEVRAEPIGLLEGVYA